MKTLKKMWNAISMPFVAVAVAIDESRRINEDGSWDKHNARRNRREGEKNESFRTVRGNTKYW